MEVATSTNNHHNHSHHHKLHSSANGSSSTNSKSNMSTSSSHNNNNHPHQHDGAVAATTTSNSTVSTSGVRSPFQREVREWQHIDPDTGALLSGRLEADRWVAGPQNSYGKISDSQNITQPNGTQHTQRKQLEVLQARTANGGAMQVIRTQTIQTTSSRWSSTSPALASPPPTTQAHNHLPLSSSSSMAPQLLSPSSSSSSLSSSLSSAATKQSNGTHQRNHLCTNNNKNGTTTNHHLYHHHQTKSKSPEEIGKIDDHDNDIGDDDDGDDGGGDDHHRVPYLTNGVAHRLYNNSNGFNHQHHTNNNSNSSANSNGGLCPNAKSNGTASNVALLDTEPSIKLSNLMKSSSSISSGSSNSIIAPNTSSGSTHHTAAMAGHKISLQAIVGSGAANNETKSSDGGASAALASTRTAAATSHQRGSRVFEQPAVFGQNNGWVKSRVGVNDSNEATGGGGGGGGGEASSFSDELRRHRQASPPTLAQQRHLPAQPRRVFESFRHGFQLSANDGDDDEGDDDEDLRLTARHQRRQQMPDSASTLQRSISTEDLSSEWASAANNEDPDDEPGEWKRVSKLRRSFQSCSTHENSLASSYTPRRPLDLPANSVSVSRIRAELERGRLMNAAMRSHHVDLAALDKILNPETSTDSKPVPAKRSTFLTAESLKEIRGKLKKLSDESLYKEDFMMNYQQPPAVEEQIEIHHHVRKPSLTAESRLRQLSPDEESEAKSAFAPAQKSFSIGQPQSSPRTTNSLESRLKSRDTTSSEWHSRRKSYGFEKMSPPDEKVMYRMDASTDSGLGRSGELGNWSPTEASATLTAVRGGTVIHFGEAAKVLPAKATPAVRRRYRPIKSPNENDEEEDTLKRHSIAVDESQYVRENLRKTSQVHLNGFYEANGGADSSNSNGSNSSASLFQRNQQKRVEFCKTEVHFAAESGRVNIVETDGKPPPTQNFRRRRRTTSGPLQSLVKPISTLSVSATSTSTSTTTSGVTLFGDHDKPRKTLATTQVAYKASLVDPVPQEALLEPINVTVSIPKPLESYESSRSSYASTSGIDTTDNETDEFSSIRGILKNKPIKPKPYHLGENFDTADALWGVQLKPVPRTNVPATSVHPQSSVAEDSTTNRNDSKNLSNGYSTKINLSLGEPPKEWPETGAQNLTQPSRRFSAQELMLQDLREHQRILDQGLKSTSLIIKTMRSANEFDEAMRRLSIASLDSTSHVPPIVAPTPMLRSNSYQESSRRHSTASSALTDSSTSSLNRRYSTDSYTDQWRLFANGGMPVSQQLSQLRRMYNDGEEDSADEEVKSYFTKGVQEYSQSDSGDGTQDSSSVEDDMQAVEYSNSWSRLKAKKTIWRIEVDGASREQTDLPTSNVMSIELHSPMAESSRQPTTPVAKPRLLSSVHSQQPTVLEATSVKQNSQLIGELRKEPLKIIKETRGARKLKEHELSYFGVQVPRTIDEGNEVVKPKVLISTPSSRRTLPRAEKPKPPRHDNDATKWPDLLRHSNPGKEQDIKGSRDEEEHFYENISNELTPIFKVKAPEETKELHCYDRKTDLKRDAQILSEMTHNADQTMKALSDESAIKGQHRRSLHRRPSKPLETINEKAMSERITDQCIAVKVSRSTMASEAKRNSRHSTPSPTGRHRTSSQSSVESISCPRDRSRSLSSEREYENVKVKRGHAAPMASPKGKSFNHRSSTAHHTPHGSSGDEAGKARNERPTRPTRTKRLSASSPSTSVPREKAHREREDRGDRSKYRSSSQRASSTTHSSQKERVECSTDVRAGSTSSRRRKEDSHDSLKSTKSSASGRSTRGDKPERSGGSSRLVDSHHRPKDSEKDKSTKSKGHSSRSVAASKERHSSTQRKSETPTKIRDHRKTTSSTDHHSSGDPMTHSKNHSLFNGHDHHGSASHSHHHTSSQHRSADPHHQPLHHVHALTTTTIAAKHRERSGKDRK